MKDFLLFIAAIAIVIGISFHFAMQRVDRDIADLQIKVTKLSSKMVEKENPILRQQVDNFLKEHKRMRKYFK